MHDTPRLSSAIALISLITLTVFATTEPARADQNPSSAASARILQAERALQRKEYLTATIEYRKAAEESKSVEVARKATRLGFAYRFNEEALLAAKRWVQLDKDSDEARAFLGQIYFRLGDLRNARRQFERLIKSGPEEPGDRLLTLIGSLTDERAPERADELMRSLAKPYKKSSSAHYAVAVLALHAGDSAYAKERIEQSLEIDPDYIKPQLLYARALMFEDDQDGAIEHLAHLIGDSARPDPDARMELALLYMMTGRDDDALSQVNQVSLETSGRTDALRLMAIINFRLERLDAAWDDFQDLLASGEYRMDALYYLARIADYRGEHKRAVRLYREVRYGSNTVFSQRRASALMAHELDNVAGAFDLLDDFAEASPNNAVDMLVAKAQLLISVGRYDEGIENYDKAAEYRPDDEGMTLGRGELLLRTGRIDEAVAAYMDAVKRWPESALSLNALGYTLADRTDRFVEAEGYIRRAIEIEPESAAIIDSLGWVLFKLGRHEEALVELERAFALLDDQEVAAHVIEVLAMLERDDEALAILTAAEEKDPDSEMLEDVRTRLFPAAP